MTLRLAAEGRMDFRYFDRFNPKWWQMWRYQIKHLTNEDNHRLTQLRFNCYLAYVSSSRISSEAFNKKQKEIISLYEDMRGELRPWLGRTAEERHVSEYAQFREDWKRVTGFDPEDKEAMAVWENEVLGGMDAKATKGQAEMEAAQAQLAASLQIMENIQRKRAAQSARPPRRGKL